MSDGNERRQKFLDALYAGDADYVRELLREEPGLANARNEQGISALRFAHYNRRPDLAETLLEAGPELDLHDAATIGDVELLERRLDEPGVEIDAMSADGFAPLHLAAFFGREEAVGKLLERGASPSLAAVGMTQQHPLHAAIAGRHRAIARRLLEAGADPNGAQRGGFTALHAAARQGDLETVRLLMAHGADPEQAAEDGRHAYHFAAEGGHSEVYPLLERSEGGEGG